MKNAALKCAALTVLSRSTFKKTLYATFDKVAQKTQIKKKNIFSKLSFNII